MELLDPRLRSKAARIALYLCVIAISYLATTSRTVPIASGASDKTNHILAFFTLTLLAHLGYPKIKNAVFLIAPLIVYGFLIELVQQQLPHRDFSLADIAADLIGCLLFFVTQRFVQLVLKY